MLQKQESKSKIKVGVFVPQSPAHPKASLNFANGIKLYFTLFENRFPRGAVELEMIDIGSGSTSKVKEKAQELLMNFRPDLVLGYMNSSVGIELANMLNEFDIPVLISNLGENTVEPSEIPENLFFNTFQFWQSYYHLGKYLSSELQSDWLIISSLHDTGYDPLRAFRLGLTSNHANIAQEIYLNASSGREIVDEFNNKFKGSKQLTPAVFFPPSLLEPILEELSNKSDLIVTTPFYIGLNKTLKYWAFPENTVVPKQKDMVKGVEEYLGVEADLFHLLGYRAGAILYGAAKSMEKPNQDKANILKTWNHFNIQLDDETISIDPDSHDFVANTSVYKGMSNLNQYKKVHEVPSNNIDEITREEMTKDKSAFMNPYMFF